MKNMRIEDVLTGSCIGLVIGVVIGAIVLRTSTNELRELEADNSPVIIWNDDTESIPTDGELVRIEMTQNDTIYIGPNN
jgi:gas vesicle protein